MDCAGIPQSTGGCSTIPAGSGSTIDGGSPFAPTTCMPVCGQSEGEAPAFSASSHGMASETGCCQSGGQTGPSSAAGETGFTEPSPIQPVTFEMPDFEGSQKLAFHDGEAIMEFYDKDGNHIESMSMEEFSELTQKASEGDEEAITKLEELGASEALIDELRGEDSCGCSETPPPEEPPGCGEPPDTGLEDLTLEYNEETGEYELTAIESFDSYEDAVAAYEHADGDAGIRFNHETGKWEVQEVQTFDDLADALEAIEALPEPIDRTLAHDTVAA
ncbi:MAG: hypothetical protein AAGA73_00420 [Pseudomonadota bacterium]